MARRVGITYRFEEKLGPYAGAIRKMGLEPVPLLPPGPESLAGLDGLLISGGTDLNPALYRQTRIGQTEDADDARDAMEMSLLARALDAGLPLLCICRGMQLFNVARGGDLRQHIDNAQQHVQRGVLDAHEVTPAAGTRLAAITGEVSYSVNSRHHQAVERVADGLVVSAYSADGVIEGLELPGARFVVAVQWHPEDRVELREADTKLFAAFAEAVRDRVECGAELLLQHRTTQDRVDLG